MRINRFVDKVVLLNLDRRPDRLEVMKRQLDSLQIVYKRIPAVDAKELGVTGSTAIAMSHKKILELAKRNEWRSVLILEDDAHFVEDFLEQFNAISKTIPKDWDILYLGAGQPAGRFVAPNLKKVTNAITTHAIAINERVYDTLLDLNKCDGRDIDIVYSHFLRRMNAYAITPAIVTQSPGMSDRTDKFLDMSKTII